MFDLVQLKLSAGDGGDGKVSFRREKYVPKGGPDGGNGGNGGSLYVRGSKHLNTLQHFAGVKEYKAQDGQDGGKQNQIGYKGEDLTLEVPVGTIIWLIGENNSSRRRRLYPPREGSRHITTLEKFYLDKPSGGSPPRPEDEIKPVTGESEANSDEPAILRSEQLKNINIRHLEKVKFIEITEHGQEVLLCQGGIGGRGNDMFKSSTNVAPFEAEYGSFGEKKVVLFELQLLADVGLIGFPNVGKSTLLSVVTKANPKIANYPFTTLEPNLGVMSVTSDGSNKTTAESRDLVLADIPGLVEGASQGKGLGFDFLRHVQSCKVLLFVLTLEEGVIFDEELTAQQKAQKLIEQFEVLENELKSYDESVIAKPRLVSISKKDLYDADLQAAISSAFEQKKYSPIFFSAVTREGVDQLKSELIKQV